MPRYVALLRAINVGKRIVKMDKLRTIFEEQILSETYPGYAAYQAKVKRFGFI